MPLVYCNKDDKALGDNGLFCYVNSNGKHVSPRQCKCKEFTADAKERNLKNFPEEIRNKYPKDVHTMPPSDYKKYRLEKYGKVNPNCPIEEAIFPLMCPNSEEDL